MKNVLTRIDKDSWFPFMVFAVTIFIKCVLFHYSCFGYVAVSSLWHCPLEFFAFYFAKLLPALFIASFVFLTKRLWWTIGMSVVVDLWLVSNVIYFKINYLFLDFETISIVGNLNGFWDSILPFLSLKDFVYLLITLCYGLYVGLFCTFHKGKLFPFFIVITISVLFAFYDCFLGYGGIVKFKESPWQTAIRSGKGTSARTLNSPFFVERGSGLHYLPAYLMYKTGRFFFERNNEMISQEDDEKLGLIFNPKSVNQEIRDMNLVVLIVESLESWVLNLYDESGSQISPHLNELSANNFVAYKIKSEARGGSSGDGQMIVNTGLLPISSGAACMLYGNNYYPSFVKLYNNAYVIDPCAGNVWNQLKMTKAYGYKDNIPNHGQGGDDAWVANLFISILDTINTPFCCQIITISMHTPFTSVSNKKMSFPDEMPQMMKDYLQSVHFTDSCIGNILLELENKSLLKNTTVVITGDHTIFKGSTLREFQSFAEKYNYPIPKEESYCPLIIYSPTIKGRLGINDLCYQMDIFPTILHCIGADDYYWKGFGVNLLDSAARHNRIMTEDEAYILSDKMIRSDWFSN